MKKLSTFLLASLCTFSSFSQSKGLHFDGVDDYLTIPERMGVLTTGSFTIETWMKMSSLPSMLAPLVHKMDGGYGRGLDVYIWDDGVFGSLAVEVYTTNGVYALYYPFPSSWINVWHHVAITYNGSLIQLYVDGVSVKTAFGSGVLTTTGGAVVIGYMDPFNPGYFSGTLDEFRFWNTARSQAQIQASRSTEIAANTSGLTGYYRFNQGTVNGNNISITGATDQVAANSGTLLNFARNGAASNFTTGYNFLTLLALKDGSFTAAKKEGGVELTWSSTASEEALTFSIERSANGSQFDPIGVVIGAASTRESSHMFLDRNPLQSNYYRIRSTDAGGKISYSKTIAVADTRSQAGLGVFPNPASSVIQLQVTAPKGVLLVEIKDLSGRTVQTARLISTGKTMTAAMDISKLSNGLYTMSAGNASTVFSKQ